MSDCKVCDETSPSPVTTVNVTSTIYSFGDLTLIEHEWVEDAPDGITAIFTMDATFVLTFFVLVGGVVQSATEYTMVGDQLTFSENVPAGAKIVVKGMVVSP